MVHYRSINIIVYSPFAFAPLPEYWPYPQLHSPVRDSPTKTKPLIDDKTSTCSVYIPVYPSTQFWITYSIDPPVPENQQFLFKLYVNGIHIVNWTADKEQRWRGKTMFGLYDRGEDQDGKKVIEKRALCFAAIEKESEQYNSGDVFGEDARIEIRVHRAHGKKRVPREMEVYSKTAYAKDSKGIELRNAGRANSENPKRFYKLALIDPVDQPFATFRFHYRTLDQIRALNLGRCDTNISGDANDLPVIDPDANSMLEMQQNMEDGQMVVRSEPEDVFQPQRYAAVPRFGPHRMQRPSSAPENTGQRRLSLGGTNVRIPTTFDGKGNRLSDVTRAYIPSGAPLNQKNVDTVVGNQSSGRIVNPKSGHLKRLSIPPRLKLEPPQKSSQEMPMVPQKHCSNPSSSSISYRPHPAYPLDDWAVNTPSPVASLRNGIGTPPLGSRRGLTATGLMDVIARSWRGSGTTNLASSNETDNRDERRKTS